jgi:hypothetical protein
MNALSTKDEVDPCRFTGKNFSRRKAFPDSHDDYCILIDGLVCPLHVSPLPLQAQFNPAPHWQH